MNNNKRFRWNKGFVFFILFLPAFFFMGFIVMFLWNHILPGAIHANAITYWQGLGILILSRILFGGFNKRHWSSERRMHGGMREKFANMTPEERENFKAGWKDRCNRWKRKDDTSTTATE